MPRNYGYDLKKKPTFTQHILYNLKRVPNNFILTTFIGDVDYDCISFRNVGIHILRLNKGTRLILSNNT